MCLSINLSTNARIWIMGNEKLNPLIAWQAELEDKVAEEGKNCFKSQE